MSGEQKTFQEQMSGPDAPKIEMPEPSASQRLQAQFEQRGRDVEEREGLNANNLSETIQQIVYILNNQDKRPTEAIINREERRVDEIIFEIDGVGIQDARVILSIAQTVKEGGDNTTQNDIIYEVLELSVIGRLSIEDIEKVRQRGGLGDRPEAQPWQWAQQSVRLVMRPACMIGTHMMPAHIIIFDAGYTTITPEDSSIQFTNHSGAPRLDEAGLNAVLAKVVDRMQE